MRGVVWLLLTIWIFSTCSESHRRARHLVFTPNGAKVQFILGFGVPIDLPHQALTMGCVMKSNYLVPNNATMYTRPFDAFPLPSSARRRRAPGSRHLKTDGTSPALQSAVEETADPFATRWDLYAVIEHAVEQMAKLKSGTGRQCLLRAVCESAVFNLRHDGLFGELLHVLLTPSSTAEPVQRHQDYEFHAAERAGRKARSAPDPSLMCQHMFSGCHTGALDLFTRILPF